MLSGSEYLYVFFALAFEIFVFFILLHLNVCFHENILVNEFRMYFESSIIRTMLNRKAICPFAAGILGLYCHEGADIGICTRFLPKIYLPLIS